MLVPTFLSFRPMGMVGEACLPNNAYYPRMSDYTLYSGVHVCLSKHSDSSFVYEFMSLDNGLGTMTTTIFQSHSSRTTENPKTLSFVQNIFCTSIWILTKFL